MSALTLLCLAGLARAQDADPSPPPEDAEEAGEVMVVTGTKTPHRLSDATVATEVVTREEIEASGARDAADVLRMHAGIDVAGSFRGAAAELRGLDPKYVLVIVDGVRVAGKSDGAVDLSRFSAEDIEQIEIVKGPASALYGADALGGVIHIRTRRAREPVEASLRVRGGSRALSASPAVEEVPTDGLFPVGLPALDATDLEARLGLRGDRLSTRAALGSRASSAYDLDPSDEDTSGSAWRELSASDRSELRLGDVGSVALDVGYRQRETRGIDPGAGGAVYDLTNLTEDFRAGLAPDLLLGADTRLVLGGQYALYRDQFLQDQRLSDELDLYTDARDHLGELNVQAIRVWGDRHTSTAGVDGLLERLQSDRISVEDAARERGAIYAQHEWTLLRDQGVSRLVLLPGLRWDLDTQFGQALSPKLALRLDPVAPLILRASYGWGYRAPDFKELYLYFENPTAGYLVEGNPELRPEHSRSLDLSVTWEPSRSARVGLAAFRNDVEDLIEPTLVADDPDETDGISPYRMENVASAVTQGLELSASARARERLTLDAGYTFLDTRNNDLDLPLEGRPAHRVTLELMSPALPLGLEGTLRGAACSRQPYYADDDGDGEIELAWVDGFVDLGARLARPLGEVWTLSLGADNLIDAGDATYNRLPPRMVWLAVDADWPGKED